MVLVLLRARSRFAVVLVMDSGATLRGGVVMVGGCLSNGGQQGCHSYDDEFFHDCYEN